MKKKRREVRNVLDGAGQARFAVLCVLALVAVSSTVLGQEVRFFQTQTRASFLEGELETVAVDVLGTLRLGEQARKLAALEEPFLFSAASHPDGWVLGTGNSGNILMVDRQGETNTLFSAPEPEIFALHVDPDGTIFAGSSPQGKVYRIKDGSAEEFYDPGETYIWALARAKGGDLLVATGTGGQLYRVDDRGKASLLYDSKDAHLRSMHILPGGEIILGTAGQGLILRLTETGKAETLYDAAQPEVVALAAGADGAFYAALLASEASLVNLSGRADAANKQKNGEPENGKEDEAAQATVVVEGETSFAGSRPNGFSGSRSEIVRIEPNGVAESIWRLESETIYSLSWSDDRLWVGTGLEGKIYSVEDRQGVLQHDLDEKQVVAFLEDGKGWAFATTNPAALYRISPQSSRAGTYISAPLDSAQVSEFGILRWEGKLPGKTEVRLAFRSGLSSEPDDTWSDWSDDRIGRALPLKDVPAGRYFQWRAKLHGEDFKTPEMSRVTVSYRQRNLAPRVTRLEVLDPGQILVPSTFNPTNQVYEPAHPNREGIFTTLVLAPTAKNGRLKTLWKAGFRTLRWEAEDENQDELTYRLSFRTEKPAGDWMKMAEHLEDTYYSFDETVLPNGIYRFRVEVFDRGENAEPPSLTGELPSEAVVVDHSPPRLLKTTRSKDGETLEVAIVDNLSPLRETVFSVDAGEWRPLSPVDGMLDSREEAFEVPLSKPDALLLMRVTDAAFNVMTFDLLGESDE